VRLKALYLPAGTAPPPGWEQPDFDDSGWRQPEVPEPVPAWQPGLPARSQPLWGALAGQDGDGTLFRVTFVAPAGEARLLIAADNWALVWLNGQPVGQTVDSFGGASLLTGRVRPGQNVLAIRGFNVAGFASPAMVQFLLSVVPQLQPDERVPLPVPASFPPGAATAAEVLLLDDPKLRRVRLDVKGLAYPPRPPLYRPDPGPLRGTTVLPWEAPELRPILGEHPDVTRAKLGIRCLREDGNLERELIDAQEQGRPTAGLYTRLRAELAQGCLDEARRQGFAPGPDLFIMCAPVIEEGKARIAEAVASALPKQRLAVRMEFSVAMQLCAENAWLLTWPLPPP